MKTVEKTKKTRLEIDGIECFMKRKVSKFGTGAKVGLPKRILRKNSLFGCG